MFLKLTFHVNGDGSFSSSRIHQLQSPYWILNSPRLIVIHAIILPRPILWSQQGLSPNICWTVDLFTRIFTLKTFSSQLNRWVAAFFTQITFSLRIYRAINRWTTLSSGACKFPQADQIQHGLLPFTRTVSRRFLHMEDFSNAAVIFLCGFSSSDFTSGGFGTDPLDNCLFTDLLALVATASACYRSAILQWLSRSGL